MLSHHTKSSFLAIGLLSFAVFASSCSSAGGDDVGLGASGSEIGGTSGSDRNAGGAQNPSSGSSNAGTAGVNAMGTGGESAVDVGSGGNTPAPAEEGNAGAGNAAAGSAGLGAGTGNVPAGLGGVGEIGGVGGITGAGSATAMGGVGATAGTDGTSASGGAQGGVAGGAHAGSAGAGGANGPTSCGGCAVLTAPLSRLGDKAPAQILFAPTDLTGKSVTLRACMVTGNANSALQVFVQNGAPKYPGDYDVAGYKAFSDLSSCTAGMQDITLPIVSVDAFDARSVSAVVVQIITTQATTGPWVTSSVRIDSIALSDGQLGPWNFNANAGALGLQDSAVRGSTLSWVP